MEALNQTEDSQLIKGLKWLGGAALVAVIAASVHAAVDPGSNLGTSPISAASDDVMITGSVAKSGEASESLRRLVDPALLRNTISHYRAGRTAQGDALAKDINDPALRSLLEWIAIRSGAAKFERITAFTEANPDWPGTANLRRRAEDALWMQRSPDKIVLGFFESQPPLGPMGRLSHLYALESTGKSAEARNLVSDIWRQDPLSKEMEERVLKTFEAVLTQADHRVRMERFLFKEKWDSALRAATRLGPDYVLLAKARMAVARRAANAGKALDAVPVSLRKDSSYAFSRAQWLRRDDKPLEAAHAIEAVSRDPSVLGDGDEWWIERRLIARKLLDINEPKLAYQVASQHGASSAASRIEAEFHAGWIALRFANDADTAANHFAKAGAIAETPLSLARSNYWQGRAAETRGAQDEARSFFARAAGHPTTFYGQLARVKLGRNDLVLRIVRPLANEARQAMEARPAVKALYTLWEIGEQDLLRSLYRELATGSKSASELAAIGDVARRTRDAQATLMVGKLAIQRGFPLDIHAFPTFGIPRIDLADSPVERAILHAVARQESAFDIEAMSSAGARGLMQLMPATARETAKRAGMPFELERLTSDASYNATLGAKHLTELLKSWNGSLPLVIASYNAGPGNVRKWVDSYGDPRHPDVDPVDWIERIPFTETRDYVQRVLENLQVYRQRFGERTTLLTEADLRQSKPVP
jgi:soluble lytic murein transglycosylase